MGGRAKAGRIAGVKHRISRFPAALILLYLLGAVLLSIQPLRTLLAPGSQGILYKGWDESQYTMRVTQAIFHPWTDVSNSIVSGDGAPAGLQMTFFEMTAGSLLGWTGLSGPVIAFALSILLAPLAMVFLGILARRFGCSERVALLAAALYFFLLFGPLRRMVHQSWSLPYVLGTLVFMDGWFRQRTASRSIALGILLGLLPGIYFWAWSFGWATFGILVLLECMHLRRTKHEGMHAFLDHVLITGVVAVIVASPFFWLLYNNALHPASAEASTQSSLIHAREFESIPRSLTMLAFLVLGSLTIVRSSVRRKLAPLAAIITGLFLVLHQQFIHGLVLSYWTHYYPYVCAAAMLMIAVLFCSKKRGVIEYLTIGVAAMFLTGAWSDYKGRMSMFFPIPRAELYQHLAEPVTFLRSEAEKQTVLSDADASLIVGAYTDDDLAYSPFLKHTLVTFHELADRYCLTQIPNGALFDDKGLADNVKELSAAGAEGTERLFEQHVSETREVCDRTTKGGAAGLLRTYGVTRLLWDERNHPEWRIDPRLFELIEKGDGWSLWSVR